MANHLLTSDPAVFNSRVYDYLVIGGGTAGLALASRLAEDEDITVGVLEAGHDHRGDLRIDIPGLYGSIVGTDDLDWKFETITQPGLGERKLPWPRGRVLGGTSAMNFVVWNRGARQDYDAWEQLGNPGWDWESLLPYFKKSETLILPSRAHQEAHKSAADPAFHGTSGPIVTSFSAWYAGTHAYWHDTLDRVNIPKNESPLNGSNIGSWTSLTTVDPATATRSYSASAYLSGKTTDAAGKANLVILTGALVRKIVLSPDSDGKLRATGVEYSHDEDASIHTTQARLEIVIAAGTIQSPQLLEVSGIGDREILSQAGVDVKYENRNVGRNLQDHLMTLLAYEIKADSATTGPEELEEDPAAKAAAEKLYAEKKDGIYRSSPSSMAYVPLVKFLDADRLSRLQQAVSEKDSVLLQPDLQPSQRDILARQLSDSRLGHVEIILHHGNSFVNPGGEPGKRYASLHQIQQYPFARGSVHIQTADTADPPRIDPAYYWSSSDAAKDPASVSPDLEILTAGTVFAVNVVARQSPLSDIIVRRVWPPEEGDEDKGPVPRSTEEWHRFVQTSTVTDWHPVGTAAMMPEDQGGVVDARLRVYGVNGLRVVDASIIPLHISSHLQATVYAIAEKGASLIREDRLQSKA